MRHILLCLLLLPAACADTAPQAVAEAPLAGCELQPRGALQFDSYRGLVLLPVRINGQPARLMLDTGANATALTSAAVGRLGLARDYADVSRIASAGGTTQDFGVRPIALTLADTTLPNQRVIIGQVPQLPVDPPIDGVLGAPQLAQFDIDLNYPEHTLTLYRARLCPTAEPPWPGPYALALSGPAPLGHLRMPMQLDGHRMSGLLDTGVTDTSVSPEAALAAGATAAQLAADPVWRVASMFPDALAARRHRFGQLRVGRVQFRNPVLLVGPMPRGIDFLLGADYLAGRRVWLGYSSGRVFVSLKPAQRAEAEGAAKPPATD